MSSQPPLLPPDEEQALHRRLCEGDRLAVQQVCRIYLNPLADWLSENNRKIEDSLLLTAAHEAVLGLLKRPQSYDPSRMDLFAYLRMAAQADLRNLLRQKQRHERKRESWEVVEKGEDAGNYQWREEDPAVLLERAESQQAAADWLRTTSADWTEQERQVLELMLQGEKRTQVFAGVIGTEGLSFAEQQEVVNRLKDRIMKRLKREVKRRE